MFTFIAFILCVAGGINWLMIGLLQYDYIAGFFGFQASIFSRIFYILFGIGVVYLCIRVIANKGTFKVFERKKKKKKEQLQQQNSPVYADVEAAKEQTEAQPDESNEIEKPEANEGLFEEHLKNK